MAWELAGTKLDARHPLLQNMSSSYVTIGQERYLIRGGYCVPYFDPHAGGDETITRERLNIELCHRIVRESEIRTVTRSIDIADHEINKAMADYEKNGLTLGRGKAVILFQNIVNRIRELSQDFLFIHQSNASHGLVSSTEKETQERIKELYEFIMVEHQEIMSAIRREDGTEDIDGTIREMFSELGKPHRVPLAMIFESRATKIGKAMAAIDRVADHMCRLLEHATNTPQSQVILSFRRYVASIKKLCGIPSADHENFNQAAEESINVQDETHHYLSGMDYIGIPPAMRLAFAHHLDNGFKLIRDMQQLRDERAESVKRYETLTTDWLNQM